MPTFDYTCQNLECGEKFEWFGKFEERTDQLPCPACGEVGQYGIGSPLPMKNSYLDGQRRKTDKAWNKMKDESKLKVARARTHKTAEKEQMTREIDKVRGNNRGPRKKIVDQINWNK